MAIDLDAVLAEADDHGSTEVVLRGTTWTFRHLREVPMSLFIDDVGSSVDELQRLALLLSNAVDPKQRKAFADLEITVREAQALFDALVEDQQGVTPGESEASPEAS